MRQIFSSITYRHKYLSTVLPGCLIFGIFIYFVLSHLLSVDFTVSITLSVIFSFLLFGLAAYCLANNNRTQSNMNTINHSNTDHRNAASSFVFAIIYIALLLIIGISYALPSEHSMLYADWQGQFMTFNKVVQLGAAIVLSFFLPGYAIVKMLSHGNREKGNNNATIRLLPVLGQPLLRILVAYLFSILVTGLTTYIIVIIAHSIPVSIELAPPGGILGEGQFTLSVPDLASAVLIAVYTLILVFFVIHQKSILLLLLLRIIQRPKNAYRSHVFTSRSLKPLYSESRHILWSFFGNTEKVSKFIIFVCLFALVIFYTYYLDEGRINGDQWYHHGRALLINSGSFVDIAASGSDAVWQPPFFSSLLAAFFNLSGVPSVNAYVSINFLNIMPVFAFYYFFTRWVSERRRKAAVLATTLFMLGSGFGWIYVIGMTMGENATSNESYLELFDSGSSKTHDVRTPTSFINVGHPTPSSPLLIIALPAGLVLLGIVKENYNNSRLKYFVLVTIISTLGIFTHDEFYLFILISTLAILILKIAGKNIVFISFLSALSLAILLNIVSPQKYYTSNEIFGIPLLYLIFVFVCFVWLFYKVGILYKLYDSNPVSQVLKRIRSYSLRIPIGIVIVSVTAYLYLFTFIVWEQLSVDDVRIHISSGKGLDIPWYLYPMKLGIVGLLGLTFLLSYIFRKFEKELFIFGIIAIVALFTGPYYNEHRFSKFLMMGMAGFASLLIYEIIVIMKDRLKPSFYAISCGLLLGIVITSASFSILLFAGYKDLALKNPETNRDFHLVDFPSPSEMNMLSLLHSGLSNPAKYSVAILDNDGDYANTKLFDMIDGFSGVPLVKLLQSPLTLNASTLEGFYSLLDHSDTKYIVIPKPYIDIYGAQGYFSYPTLFSIDNFPKVYEDSNYIVLEVPPLTPPGSSLPPSSQSQSGSLSEDSNGDNEVALIYQKDAQEWLMPLLNNDNSNDINDTNSFVIPILRYTNESLSSPSSSSSFNFTSANNDNKHTVIDIVGNDNNYTSLSSASSNNSIVKAEKKQGTTIITLNTLGTVDGDSGTSDSATNRIDLWSNPIPQILREQQENNNKSINYIECTFRITAENYTSKKEDDAGILWKYGDNEEYYLVLKSSGLELTQREKQLTTSSPPFSSFSSSSSTFSNQKQDIDDKRETTKTSLLVQNQEIKRERGIWYNIKILFVDNSSINVYVNDMLRMQIPIKYDSSSSSNSSILSSFATTPSSLLHSTISEVGIRSSNNMAEFQSIKIGHISPPTIPTILESNLALSAASSSSSSSPAPPLSPSLASYIKEKKYERHYYPLSMLALSKANYDTYIEGDLSAFSKKYVVLPFDPPITTASTETDATTTTLDQRYHYNNNNNDLTKYYLEYVRNGGNLIVIDSEYNYNNNNNNNNNNNGSNLKGIFSELLSIKPGNFTKFNGIIGNTKNTDPSTPVAPSSSYFISTSSQPQSSYINTTHTDVDPNPNDRIANVSGIAQDIIVYTSDDNNLENLQSNTTTTNSNDDVVVVNSNDITIKSFYVYDNNDDNNNTNAKGRQNIAPFVIEKKYGNGKIIFVNAAGYFDAISKEPSHRHNKYKNNKLDFVTLRDSSRFLTPILEGSGDHNYNSENTSYSHKALSDRVILGYIEASGKTMIKSSSILFPTTEGSILNLYAKDVVISNDTQERTGFFFNSSLTQNQIDSESIKIEQLRLYGKYEAVVDINGISVLPATMSNYDYVAMSLGREFNMSLTLGDRAYADINVGTKNYTKQVRIQNATILFYNVRSDYADVKSAPLIFKSPEININGSLNFREYKDKLVNEITTDGSLVAKFDHADHYYSDYRDGSRIEFVSYLEDSQVKGKSTSTQDNFDLKLPGELSERAEKTGFVVPWQKAAFSTNSIIIATSIAIFAVLLSGYGSKKEKRKR